MQAIISLQDERPFAVAPFGFIAQRVERHSAQTRIDALVAPGAIGEIIGITKCGAVQRVCHGKHIAMTRCSDPSGLRVRIRRYMLDFSIGRSKLRRG